MSNLLTKLMRYISEALLGAMAPHLHRDQANEGLLTYDEANFRQKQVMARRSKFYVVQGGKNDQGRAA